MQLTRRLWIFGFIFLLASVVMAQDLTGYPPEVQAAFAALDEAQAGNLNVIGTLNYRYVASYAVENDLCSTSPNNVPMPSQYPTPIYIVLLMVKLRDDSDGHFT